MSECLLDGSSPELYPALRPPMAPLCEWDGVINPCMSAWPPGIAVDGPTAWLRNTWIASSRRSNLSSIRLCCRMTNRINAQIHHNEGLFYLLAFIITIDSFSCTVSTFIGMHVNISVLFMSSVKQLWCFGKHHGKFEACMISWRLNRVWSLWIFVSVSLTNECSGGS